MFIVHCGSYFNVIAHGQTSFERRFGVGAIYSNRICISNGIIDFGAVYYSAVIFGGVNLCPVINGGRRDSLFILGADTFSAPDDCLTGGFDIYM